MPYTDNPVALEDGQLEPDEALDCLARFLLSIDYSYGDSKT